MFGFVPARLTTTNLDKVALLGKDVGSLVGLGCRARRGAGADAHAGDGALLCAAAPAHLQQHDRGHKARAVAVVRLEAFVKVGVRR